MAFFIQGSSSQRGPEHVDIHRGAEPEGAEHVDIHGESSWTSTIEEHVDIHSEEHVDIHH